MGTPLRRARPPGRLRAGADAAAGRLRGHDGIRRYYAEVTGRTVDAVASEYAITEVGDTVIVSGSLHTVDANGAVQQRQVHWVYWVREGKVQRAVSFARRDQAEEAAHRSG